MCISIYIYIERYIGIDIDIKLCIMNRERIKEICHVHTPADGKRLWSIL